MVGKDEAELIMGFNGDMLNDFVTSCPQEAFCLIILLIGRVGNFGETSSSALEFENTQPEKICHFLTEPLLQHTRART